MQRSHLKSQSADFVKEHRIDDALLARNPSLIPTGSKNGIAKAINAAVRLIESAFHFMKSEPDEVVKLLHHRQHSRVNVALRHFTIRHPYPDSCAMRRARGPNAALHIISCCTA